MAHADLNIFVSGLLDDLASVQRSVYPRRAYERAARAVALLEHPVTTMPAEAIARIPHIGRTAQQVIRDVVATGESPTVARAVRSGDPREAERRRSLRDGFISLAAARQVLHIDEPGLVGRRHYRGDLQMHTGWSDGARSVAEMALACAQRGYRHLAITDHARGLAIARGLSSASMAAQHREIDEVNAVLAGRLLVLKGVEANIDAEGGLDVSAADRASCDVVLAAPHSKLDTTADQTMRLLTAIATPGVHILAHPSGRKFGKRPGLRVDWDRVFAAAARHRVAIELDGDPSRQDIPFALVHRALDAGCVFAIDSDAHDVDQLVYAEIALAHARLAGVPPARVINCWATRKLLGWLERD